MARETRKKERPAPLQLSIKMLMEYTLLIVMFLWVSSPAISNAAAPSFLTRTDSDTLFNARKIPSFEFTLPRGAWQDLQRNALDEKYTSAYLNVIDQKVGEVRIRFEGSVGTLSGCFDQSGKLICPKLSIKIRFNAKNKNKRFFGLKRLNLHAMVRDDTKMAEKISYNLFRAMKVVAPRVGYALVKVNGQSYGLYATVEQVGGVMADRYWPSDHGHIYKEVWPQSADPKHYAEGLKNNEDTADNQRFVEFYKAMATAAPERRLAVLHQWTDISYLYRYMAVNDLISNWDGVTTWYFHTDLPQPHNFYWYQHKASRKFTLIPWDMDNTLKPRPHFGMLSFVPHWTQIEQDKTKRYVAFHELEVAAPGAFPIFQALASDRRRYIWEVKRLLKGPFNIVAMNKRIDYYAAQIREEIHKDPTHPSFAQWEKAVSNLKADLPLLAEKLKSYARGKPIRPMALRLDAVNDFETGDLLELKLGVNLESSAHCSAELLVNTAYSIAGDRDLKLNFVHRDELKAWYQRVSAIISLEGGKKDLSVYRGLKIRLKSKVPRTVRVNLMEKPYTGNGSFGWDVDVNRLARTTTLLFGNAKKPDWVRDRTVSRKRVIAAVWGLGITPAVIKRKNNGFLGRGGVDRGSIQIDEIEFIR